MVLGGGFECVIIVSNMESFSWSGDLELLAGQDEQWAGAWKINGIEQQENIFDFEIPGNGTQKYRLSGDPTVRAGYLELDGGLGSSDYDVAVQFFYEYRQGGTLIDSTGTPEGDSGHSFR